MKKASFGRSMLEMLGVLSVIGILSLGGLHSYNIAMAKIKANKILEYTFLCIAAAQTHKVDTFIEGYCKDIMGEETTIPSGLVLNQYAIATNKKVDVYVNIPSNDCDEEDPFAGDCSDIHAEMSVANQQIAKAMSALSQTNVSERALGRIMIQKDDADTNTRVSIDFIGASRDIHNIETIE